MRDSATAPKKKGDSIPLNTDEEDSSERSILLLSHSTRWRPEPRFANRSRVALLRILLPRRANCRSFPDQHEHQILRRKMFLDHLLRYLRRHRVDARLQLVDLVVAQPIQFVRRDNLRQLPRSLNVWRRLPLDKTIGRFQLLVRYSLLVQFLQHLHRQVKRRRGRLILGKAENPKRPRRFPRIEERGRPVRIP